MIYVKWKRQDIKKRSKYTMTAIFKKVCVNMKNRQEEIQHCFSLLETFINL